MRAVEAFLDSRPYDDVYVRWLLASGQIDRTGELLAWRDDAGAVTGTCYAGMHFVPSAISGEAVDAFAAHVVRAPRARTIVGPRPSVERFFAAVRPVLPRPRALRPSQPLYAVARRTLRGSRESAPVARATRDEVDEIARNSALMIAGEVGGDPKRATAEFRDRTAKIVEAGWWWRYRIDGRLAFMCNVGSATSQTAMLQGVWSPPEMRGSGYARRALAAICDYLLESVPTLCLYVNAFNRPAIALYEAVGFERVGEFASILY